MRKWPSPGLLWEDRLGWACLIWQRVECNTARSEVTTHLCHSLLWESFLVFRVSIPIIPFLSMQCCVYINFCRRTQAKLPSVSNPTLFTYMTSLGTVSRRDRHSRVGGAVLMSPCGAPCIHTQTWNTAVARHHLLSPGRTLRYSLHYAFVLAVTGLWMTSLCLFGSRGNWGMRTHDLPQVTLLSFFCLYPSLGIFLSLTTAVPESSFLYYLCLIMSYLLNVFQNILLLLCLYCSVLLVV